jgi:hypothetical protein
MCFDPDLKRRVAIKKLDRFAFDVAGQLIELEAPGRLSHPNIVTIHDVMHDIGAIVMEYVPGGTLARRLQSDRPWVLGNFTRLMTEICEALRAAHAESIIHRDIKPENILITSDGHAKVADFGVCAILSSAEYTDGIAGSPAYMAKEVLAGEQYSFEADVHSLGCVMFEIWAGRLPFLANGGLAAFLAVKSQAAPPSLLEASSDNPDDILSDLVARMLTTGPRRIRNIDTVTQQLALREPRPSDRAASIDDLQLELGGIYGYSNNTRAPLYLMVQYLISVRSIVQELLRSDGARDSHLDRLFPKSFAWLCASATSVNVRLGQLIWLKFDGECPYCQNRVCTCNPALDAGKSIRNSELLERMQGRVLTRASAPQTFQQYQAMFERIFGPANQRDGLPTISVHAYSEIAEALDAVLHLLPHQDSPSVLALHLECSDLIAWFFALLNSYDRDYDFIAAFRGLFASGCYACGQRQCVCPEPLGVNHWRLALQAVPAYE